MWASWPDDCDNCQSSANMQFKIGSQISASKSQSFELIALKMTECLLKLVNFVKKAVGKQRRIEERAGSGAEVGWGGRG